MRTRNIGLFAVAGLGLSLSLTILIMSGAFCQHACPNPNTVHSTLPNNPHSDDLPNTCAPWAVLLTYSLLSLPIAILLVVGIQTRKSVAINGWLVATVVQVLIEIAVVGFLFSEMAKLTAGGS